MEICQVESKKAQDILKVVKDMLIKKLKSMKSAFHTSDNCPTMKGHINGYNKLYKEV